MTKQNFCGISKMIFTKVSANMDERMTDFHVYKKYQKNEVNQINHPSLTEYEF